MDDGKGPDNFEFSRLVIFPCPLSGRVTSAPTLCRAGESEAIPPESDWLNSPQPGQIMGNEKSRYENLRLSWVWTASIPPQATNKWLPRTDVQHRQYRKKPGQSWSPQFPSLITPDTEQMRSLKIAASSRSICRLQPENAAVHMAEKPSAASIQVCRSATVSSIRYLNSRLLLLLLVPGKCTIPGISKRPRPYQSDRLAELLWA